MAGKSMFPIERTHTHATEMQVRGSRLFLIKLLWLEGL